VRSTTRSFSAASLRAVLEVHTPEDATGLVIALSGGADSAALLIAAAGLGDTFRGLTLRAVHVDHGMQAAAASFRAACTASCAALHIPLTIVAVRIDAPPGTSLEAAAREARYAAFAAELRPGECLLTAHHAEDQAETLLLQALRGAGVKGLSAMPLCRPLGSGWHLRPLLEVPQAALLAVEAGAAGTAVPDPMNQDVRFDRSYLRHQVWPLIETRWPGSAAALTRTARHAAEAQEMLDAAAAAELRRLRDGDALSVPGMRALTAGERVNVLRYWLQESGVEPPSSVRLTEALRQIFEAQDDHMPAIPWGHCALRRYRQRIFITAAEPPRLDGTRRWRVEGESRVDLGPELGTLCWSAQIGGLDFRRMPEFLTVRRRGGGETLRPNACAKTQTVQHLCQAQGVLPWMRDALPLVFADESLIAVADLWQEASRCAAAGTPGFTIRWENAPIIV
jgi:tRNA(Ile)-lysidine synthase